MWTTKSARGFFLMPARVPSHPPSWPLKLALVLRTGRRLKARCDAAAAELGRGGTCAFGLTDALPVVLANNLPPMIFCLAQRLFHGAARPLTVGHASHLGTIPLNLVTGLLAETSSMRACILLRLTPFPPPAEPLPFTKRTATPPFLCPAHNSLFPLHTYTHTTHRSPHPSQQAR